MKRILVCDDNAMILKTIEHKLTTDGYEVITAKDGKQAADIIQNNHIDLILTDMLMPFLSGMELINFVRNELKKDIPIIVLSKVGAEDTQEDAYDLGADDYLPKPFNPNIMSMKIKRLLKE